MKLPVNLTADQWELFSDEDPNPRVTRDEAATNLNYALNEGIRKALTSVVHGEDTRVAMEFAFEHWEKGAQPYENSHGSGDSEPRYHARRIIAKFFHDPSDYL